VTAGVSEWRQDVLGEGFECTDIDLGRDEEGPVVATLVRALPQPLSFWSRLRRHDRGLEDCDVLYVHGWSDYFFQRHLAQFFTTRGARFFALDLRKYGRSLRDGQIPGYIDDIARYDEEIDAAVKLIRGDAAPDTDADSLDPERRPLVLLGHSTGGLVLSLWADRHRGAADALVLNSPWLELQLSAAARRAIAPIVNLRARLSPRDLAIPQLDMGFYAQAQRETSTPEELAAINRTWRPEFAMPVRVAWLRAILTGHARIAEGIDPGAPVCVLLSARSSFGLNWHPDMARTDSVLEVGAIARAALGLGPSVTIERIDGALHDVFLSAAPARAEAFARLDRWLLGWRGSLARAR